MEDNNQKKDKIFTSDKAQLFYQPDFNNPQLRREINRATDEDYLKLKIDTIKNWNTKEAFALNYGAYVTSITPLPIFYQVVKEIREQFLKSVCYNCKDMFFNFFILCRFW